MTLLLREFGKLTVSKIRYLDSDEYEITDKDTLLSLETKTIWPVSSAYIVREDDGDYVLAYLNIPEELKLFIEDVVVYEIIS